MIHIEKPCEADVFSMPRCGSSYACSLCHKQVTDLRKQSTEKVNLFLNTNQESCVIVHARHEEKNSGRFTWVNRVELWLERTGWRRTAFAATFILLFLASCGSRRKHVVGRFSFKADMDKKEAILPPGEQS